MSREEAIEHIKATSKLAIDAGYDSDIVDACAMAVRALEQVPKQGQWETEKKGTFGAFYRCSECCELYHTKTTYCPFCGAKLESEVSG